MPEVLVIGGFDNPQSQAIRFLEEASRLGRLTVALLSDETLTAITGKPPGFPQAERLYLLESIRYIDRIILAPFSQNPDELPDLAMGKLDSWVVTEDEDTPGKQAFCRTHGMGYRVIHKEELNGFPRWMPPASDGQRGRPKVVVTGCYDWFHSGHVRFFEEVSALGDLYVIVGNDASVRFLKGEGHPLFPQAERQYIVQSVRYVHQAMITSGIGWMDAEPEIEQIKPDMYAVNEDGDKPEKRQFCLDRGIRYVVLHRAPKPGLPKRQSTELRGF